MLHILNNRLHGNMFGGIATSLLLPHSVNQFRQVKGLQNQDNFSKGKNVLWVIHDFTFKRKILAFLLLYGPTLSHRNSFAGRNLHHSSPSAT